MGCGSSTSASNVPLEGVIPPPAGSGNQTSTAKDGSGSVRGKVTGNTPSTTTPGANGIGGAHSPNHNHTTNADNSDRPNGNGSDNTTVASLNMQRGTSNSRQYSQEHASSVPAPRVSLSVKGPVSRVETERVRGAAASPSARKDTMPAVSELLVSANLALPIRGALLPNFYRSAAFSAGGSKGEDGSTGGGGSAGGSGDAFDSSMDGWSDEEDELDEEEHRETLDMLQELTALSVPSPGLKKHHSSSSDDERVHGSPTGEQKENRDATAAAAGLKTPTHKHKGSSAGSSNAPILPSASGVSVGGTASPTTANSPMNKQGTHKTTPSRRAHINSAGTETLFHGFYARRCVHSVKKSMASSGMFLTFKDMFERLDPTHSGFISKTDWASLLQKLGLPVDSATSLSRMIGLADTPQITLEQFAMVMALSMHGPYVRLLQSTQNAKRNELFLGGDKSTNSQWRKEAMGLLTKEKIPFFNPVNNQEQDQLQMNEEQKDGSDPPTTWNAELVILEALAKTQCTMMLFVVDSLTRSIASMVEASEHITSEKEVVLVMQNVAAATQIGDETLTPTETKDLNRGRAYLADVAHRNAHSGVTVFKTVAEACEYIRKRVSGVIVRPSLKAFTKPVIALPMAPPTSPAVANTPAASATGAGVNLPPTVPPPSSRANPSANVSAVASLKGSVASVKAPPVIVVPPTPTSPQPPATTQITVNPPSTTNASCTAQPATSVDAPFTLQANSPLSLSLISQMASGARRHSTGVSTQSIRASGSGGGAPSPGTRPGGMFAAAFASSGGTGSNGNSGAASTTATSSSTASVTAAAPSTLPSATSTAIGFPSEWPSNPQPADFDLYLASAHFAECVKIVFKHQGLLSRRAAVKAAAAAQATVAAVTGQPPSPQLGARGIVGANSTTEGSPTPNALPPGLFRMASSPFSPLKLLKQSGSASNLNLADLVPRSVLPPSTSSGLSSVSYRPAGHVGPTGGLHVVTQSPDSSPVPDSTSPPPMHPMPSAQAKDQSSPTASRSVSGDHSSSGAGNLLSESFQGGSIASSLSQSRVLVRMPSETPEGPEYRQLGGSKASFSSRPTTSGAQAGNGLSSSASQSKLLDPLAAAGLAVMTPIVEPPQFTMTVTNSNGGDTSTDPAVNEIVATAHLFTMLLRLHEIIQLSTGIVFLHPYPQLVAQELHTAILAQGLSTPPESLKCQEWALIARKTFSQLRGIHELEPEQTKRLGSNPTSNAASSATSPAPTSPVVPADFLLSLAAGDPSPGGGKRRSMTRFPPSARSSMGAGGLLSVVGGAGGGTTIGPGGTEVPASPMIGVGISPSQFLRHLTQGQSKRSSGTPIGNMVPEEEERAAGQHSIGKGTRGTTLLSAGRNTPDHGSSTPSSTAITAAPPVEKSKSLALIQKVKGRIAAQRKVIDLMTPRGRNPLDEASTLSSDDMSKLNASVQASLQHDQLLLKEMLPSFQGMFSSTDTQKKGSVGLDDVYILLSGKLALPEQSCESLMGVINVALSSCQHEAAASAGGSANSTPLPKEDSTATATATGETPLLPPPLPTSAFDRASLSYQAFCAVLSKTLHLQSSPFSSFLSSATSFLTRSKKVCSQVFLGGSCNPTTWRVDEAIPILSQNGVTFYNPQVDGWSEELVLIESLIKQNCEILLFVIDSETRAIASMIEAAEYICSGREVVLVVKNMPQQDAKVNNEPLGQQQVHELNRARSYVTDVAQRHGLDVFTDITLACEYICTKLREKTAKEEAYSAEVEQFICSDEFLEKSFEEFVRCDTRGVSRLNAQQLLLACLHLEQDLRPLLPPQSSKHRQPSLADVDVILNQFGSTHGATTSVKEIDAEQFLDFSRVLFRNVCAHVKL